MKKFKKTMFALSLILVLSLAMSFTCMAANVKDLKVSGEDNSIKVSGSVEAGVLACAVLVYDSTGATLVGMETCAVNNNAYDYTLDKTFAKGNYVVKVADYEGGSFETANVTVTGTVTPGTGDAMPALILTFTAAAAVLATGLVLKKKSVKE
ncbi:MAG: hypothetical protein E7242_00335 [Lachnospiraceae bacterium]|nr:hypothetical protein [Lachnospiraceae bacterium]